MAIINVSKILNYQNQKFNKIYYLTLHYDKNYRMMKYQIYRKKKKFTTNRKCPPPLPLPTSLL